MIMNTTLKETKQINYFCETYYGCNKGELEIQLLTLLKGNIFKVPNGFNNWKTRAYLGQVPYRTILNLLSLQIY